MLQVIQKLILSLNFNIKKRISAELDRLLQQQVIKMKYIVHLNNYLMNNTVEEEDLSNDRSFSQNELSISKIDNNITLNLIKNLILNNNIEEDTTLERIIDSVKNFQIKEKDDYLFNILNMRNNISFNSDNDKLHIDDNTKQKKYPLLSTLTVPFTSHTMSVLLYKIVKLSQEFPKSCIMNIKHPQGSLLKGINISK